ncbi:Hypothetical protein R9X50_00762500 [Acrodontium crateriforme]|uniref:Hamartin n=1 Tax=Acrodontium crateriforme TaxID=150365 RepID=A0AAQ3MBN1_9PEZI|nr:Hypothetical protein R9X50_00762500 [Acrodontium crateriforme]
MASKSIKDATKTLQEHFSAAKLPESLPSDSRRVLQSFVDEHDIGNIGEDESARANVELKGFWEKHVGDNAAKLGVFVGVLRELRPIITRGGDVLNWWKKVLKPVITGLEYKKAALDDAQEFLVNFMICDEPRETDEDATRKWERESNNILKDLLSIYILRTQILSDDDTFVAKDNIQISQQVEAVLIAFGRKQPKTLFHGLDDLVKASVTRLQALTLLTSFLRHQTPHLYLVTNTPLIEHLLKCLMNDTSTDVLSAALTSLLMLLPHIPGSLEPHLPRVFLIYSRLLCWEKFSPLSTEAQRNLVTDDRVAADSDDEDEDRDVGIDLSWDKLGPPEGTVEATTPELMTLFTYLYGMYPLNFLSYIRKSRRYLKQLQFPGADQFDLDQAVIRSRTEQFRQVHLIHPNFYSMTIEEELTDPKWPKAEPADVVADCYSLCVNPGTSLGSPAPPPTRRLPDLPTLPILSSRSGRNSPIVYDTAIHSTTNSWRDTHSLNGLGFNAGADSPIIRPDDDTHGDRMRPRSKASVHTESSVEDYAHQTATLRVARSPMREKPEPIPQTNLKYLQMENNSLRNELNFERWHKAQYSQHIGQLVRKNVKDATAEAETLNLINANRALKQQLEQVKSAREATIKDSALTRKQANNLETNMNERLAKLKKDQEKWVAEVDELRRLRGEAKEFRDILVATEAREVNQSYELNLMKREVEQLDKIRNQLQEAQKKLREYEYRNFEFDRTKREMDILQSENHTLQMRARNYDQERERTQRIHMGRVAELEAQLESIDPFQRNRSPNQSPPEIHGMVQRVASDSDFKLAQLKKAHARLLEKYTDLELEYQTMKCQLENLQQTGSYNNSRSFLRLDTDPEDYELHGPSWKDSDAMSGGLGSRIEPPHGMLNEPSPADVVNMTSTSDPTNSRYQTAPRIAKISPPSSEAAFHSTAGLTWRPPQPIAASRKNSTASRESSGHGQGLGLAATSFNPSAPLSEDEMAKSMMSSGSGDTTGSKKKKIQPDSEVRVYGRGGAQNIKMKSKDKESKLKSEKPKSSPLKGLRGFI